MKSYVTLTSPGFVSGTIALWKSLRRFTSFPLHAMSFDLSDMEVNTLTSLGIAVHPVEHVVNPQNGGNTKSKERFRHTYTKLRAFSLTQYEKIVFLDSDTLVLKPIDSLFNIEGFAAAPDSGRFANEHRFNSGVFVTRPQQSVFDGMLLNTQQIKSSDNSDQGFLNVYFRNRWVRLDPSFNTLKRVYLHHPKRFNLDMIKVLHFVGLKPWHNQTSPEATQYRSLHRLWQRIFDGE